MQDLTRLGSLRALRRLHISAVDLLPGQQPRALEGELPSLEHLELFGIWLLPRLVAAVALPALQSLCIWSADAGSSLNCVSHLTTLRRCGTRGTAVSRGRNCGLENLYVARTPSLSMCTDAVGGTV